MKQPPFHMHTDDMYLKSWTSDTITPGSSIKSMFYCTKSLNYCVIKMCHLLYICLCLTVVLAYLLSLIDSVHLCLFILWPICSIYLLLLL